MKKALIQGERICEFGEEFPVHKDLIWVDVANDTTTKDTYVNGVVVKLIPLTAMEIWEASMAATDNDIPRALEDIYDAMSATQQAKVAKNTRDKIIAKKELRETKP